MREVNKFYPIDLNLSLLFARILINNELYADAQMYLHRAISIDEKSDFAWAHLALIAALANDHGKSAYCAKRALMLGNHLYNTLPKAYAFALLLQGVPCKVLGFDTNAHFLINNASHTYSIREHPIIPPFLFSRDGEASGRPIVFFCCDAGYFQKFAKNLILSLIEICDIVSIHVHLIDPQKEDLDWLSAFSLKYHLDIILSQEFHSEKGLAKSKPYLASCRFLRIHEFMERHKRDYLILDVDSILNRPDLLRSFLEKVKKPLLGCAENCPIWDTISAPFVFLPYCSISRNFIKHCEQYLLHSFSSTGTGTPWYIDQLALFGAYLEYVEDILLSPFELISDTACGSEAIFWTLSNDKTKKEYNEKCDYLNSIYIS